MAGENETAIPPTCQGLGYIFYSYSFTSICRFAFKRKLHMILLIWYTWEMVSLECVNVWMSNYGWDWSSFQILESHLYFLFCELYSFHEAKTYKLLWWAMKQVPTYDDCVIINGHNHLPISSRSFKVLIPNKSTLMYLSYNPTYISAAQHTCKSFIEAC